VTAREELPVLPGGFDDGRKHGDEPVPRIPVGGEIVFAA
jgi:hypothetical protein